VHASSLVSGSASSHGVPKGASGLLHAPVWGSQVPARWQSSAASHSTAVQSGTPTQTPLAHTSAFVSGSSSSQSVSSGAGGSEHRPVAVSHVPAT
jgi:hypothetical protein